MLNNFRVLALCLPLCLTSAAVAAQTPPPDVGGMSLQDLLGVEVVSTASKFPQAAGEAPASVTVITADEIRRYGHRTLADTLRSVRGFYTTYDRNYSYIGVRGFARPGDYNTRILLLLDGHRLNDSVYDMAPIGTDFPIDVSLIERIEIIRGPGSSLYGSSAFFGVINVVTRTGASSPGFQVEVQGGSLGTRGAAGSFGRLFDNGRELLIGGSTYYSTGQTSLHYPEFETNGVGSGTATGLDDDNASNVFGSLSAGRFSIRGGVARRHKQIPTGSYGVVFGDNREATTDRRAYLAAVYDGPMGRGWLASAQAGYDYYGYQGDYPYDYGEDGIALLHDGAEDHSLTGELTARRRFARLHLFTAGIEVRRRIQNRQWSSDIYGGIPDVMSPGTNVGFYAQDEVRIRPWLIANLGVRLDRFPAYGFHTTPRAGLVWLPRRQTAVKLLYGRAFRAPNAYELSYNSVAHPEGFELRPEEIRSSEIVWEESVSKHVRTAVTAFAYKAGDIVEQRSDTDSVEDYYFANAGAIRGVGIEAEVEAKLSNGLAARFSHTFARVRDRVTSAPVSNSPAHLSKVGVQIPLSILFLSVEGQYVSERLTLNGERLGGFFAPNVTLTSPAGRRTSFALSVYNAFNGSFADPGAEEHLQPSIRQDGRTAVARVRFAF